MMQCFSIYLHHTASTLQAKEDYTLQILCQYSFENLGITAPNHLPIMSECYCEFGHGRSSHAVRPWALFALHTTAVKMKLALWRARSGIESDASRTPIVLTRSDSLNQLEACDDGKYYIRRPLMCSSGHLCTVIGHSCPID